MLLNIDKAPPTHTHLKSADYGCDKVIHRQQALQSQLIEVVHCSYYGVVEGWSGYVDVLVCGCMDECVSVCHNVDTW